MTPDLPTPGAFASFPQAFDQALAEYAKHQKTLFHAYDNGIRAGDILDFVSGERPDLLRLLAKNDWAMTQVVKLVKAKRNGYPPPDLPTDDIQALKSLDSLH